MFTHLNQQIAYYSSAFFVWIFPLKITLFFAPSNRIYIFFFDGLPSDEIEKPDFCQISSMENS